MESWPYGTLWLRAYGGRLSHAWEKHEDKWKAICNKGLVMTTQTWKRGQNKCKKCLEALKGGE